MQHGVGQTGQALQAAPVIEIGQHRRRPGSAPGGRPFGVAQHGIDAGARRTLSKTEEDAAGDVSAADDQDFLHGCIVADQ